MMMLATIDGIMIAPDHLKRIAAWSRDLSEREINIALSNLFGFGGTNACLVLRRVA